MSRTTERRNDLDWIRIIAVLLLIPFHSARIFDIGEPFYVKNTETSGLLTLLVGFLATWQMPLLFLVAGASTWYALRHRTTGQYLAERLRRLMIPFVFGTLVIIPPQMYLALVYRSNTTESYPAYLPRFFQIRPFDIPDYTGIGFSWGHLWFILNLFVISLIALPLLLALKRNAGQRLVMWLARLANRRWRIFLFAVPFVLIGDLPELDGKPVFIHLLVFMYGFVLMCDGRFQHALVRNRGIALILGATTFTTMVAVWISGVQFADDSIEDISFYLVRNLNLWCWLVAILGYGQRYLNGENKVLSYARDAAYPFYILHQTVIVAIGFVVVAWNLDPLSKWGVIASSSLVVTIALYDLVVRRTNLTRFLFGMKPLTTGAVPRISPPSTESGT